MLSLADEENAVNPVLLQLILDVAFPRVSMGAASSSMGCVCVCLCVCFLISTHYYVYGNGYVMGSVRKEISWKQLGLRKLVKNSPSASSLSLGWCLSKSSR